MEEEEKWKVVRVKRGNRKEGAPGGKASQTYPPSSGRFGVLGLAEQEPSKSAAPVPPAPAPLPPPAASNTSKAKGNEKKANPPPKAAAPQPQSKGVAAPSASVKALANKKGPTAKAPAREDAPPPPPSSSVAARPQEAATVDRPQPSASFIVNLLWSILTLGGLLTAIASLARGLFGSRGPRTLPDRPQPSPSPEPAAAAVETEGQVPGPAIQPDHSRSKVQKAKVEEKEERAAEGAAGGDSLPAPGPAAPPKAPKPAPPPPRWKALGTDGDWAAAGSPCVGGRSWRLVRHEGLHTEHVTGLAVHGADVLASVGWDTKATIYHVSPGGALAPVKALSGHTARVEVVLSLPGSDLLVTAGRDAQLLVWRVPHQDPESAARVQRHYLYEGVRCAALSPSHPTQLFLGTQSGLILHFDAAEGGRVLGKVQAHGEVTALAAHPTIPDLIFSAGSPDAESDPEVRAWVASPSGKFEPRGGPFGAGILRGRVHSLLSTKDGLYAGDFSGSVKVWAPEGAGQGTAPRALPVVPVGCGAVAPLAGLAYCAERRVLVTSAAGWYASDDSFDEAPDDAPETTAALNLLASSGAAGVAEVPLYTALLGRGLVTSLAVDEARARLFVGTTSGSVAVLHLGTPAAGGQGDVSAPVRELGLETLEEWE